MRLDVTNVRPLAITVSISDLPVASFVKNASESVRVTAMIEIPDRDTLRIHRIHWKPRSATFTLTVATLLGVSCPSAAPLIRKNDFRVWKPSTDQCVQSVAEKFRKVGEDPANDFFNLPPRPLPPVGPPQFNPALSTPIDDRKSLATTSGRPSPHGFGMKSAIRSAHTSC